MKTNINLKTGNTKGGQPQYKENLGFITAVIEDEDTQGVIVVDAFKGTGEDFTRRKKANIKIAQGTGEHIFDGTFNELVKVLSEHQANRIKKSEYLKSLKNTYLYKLIDRATSNELFENNHIGNYKITPQHGANVSVYHIYKFTDSQFEHILTIQITEGVFIEQFGAGLSKKEYKTVERFFLTQYKGKALTIKEL